MISGGRWAPRVRHDRVRVPRKCVGNISNSALAYLPQVRATAPLLMPCVLVDVDISVESAS